MKRIMPHSVALVKYEKSPDSLRDAILLSEGFNNLKKDAKILIKPNLVTWDSNIIMAPFGVFTTTRLVEDLINLLKDFGCSQISIGEGSVPMQSETGTRAAFNGLGYTALAKKYGVNLIDFNESSAEQRKTPDGMPLMIAKEALDAEFLINFPVLKTHAQTKVSLGLKNLKGCLKPASKRLCHDPKYGLEHAFQFISDFVKPSLTIIDGIYALERGALHFGTAYRKNIIIASRDPFAADLVAAKTIGYDPEMITHFKEYAARTSKSMDLKSYTVKGENLEKCITPLKWDWFWTKDNTGPGAFEKMGIKGIALPKYDETLCSGCSPLSNMINIFVMSAFQGQPFPSVEVINGKKMQARPGYETTILLGNCINKANANNPNIKKAIKILGCPPDYEKVKTALKEAGLNIKDNAYNDYLRQQSEKYKDKPDFTWEFFGKAKH